MGERSASLTWLPFLTKAVPGWLQIPGVLADFELEQGLETLGRKAKTEIRVHPDWGEDWQLEEKNADFILHGGETGVLYGAYRLLMDLAGGNPPPQGRQHPRYALRMLNCWDNPEGDVERGYAGRSLFFEGGKLSYDPARLRQLGRMLASVGINVLCINNVNTNENACKLIEEDGLKDIVKLSSLFHPFGIRLMLSVDFSHPLRCGVPTADPLDERVRAWWERQTALVYRAVPDLAGFLVKADSEHRPGPFTYGRTHSEGAHPLAAALKPHHGVLVWRCFIYNCRQDWRDLNTDRPKAAYDFYAPLDGRFDDNVILQIKHGPYDFQVREPVSPLLYTMPATRKAMELQLTQEYTGHQIDLYAMPPMWREILNQLPPENLSAIAAVGNLGRDPNWTGHPLAAVNLFAYGLVAWDPRAEPEVLIRFWCRITYGLPPAREDALYRLLINSRNVYEHYTAPLGICWMVTPANHYGPSPEGYEYSQWGTYHKADCFGIGIDRTALGTGYVCQYPADIRERYETPENCPDQLLLFFHRLPYCYVMRDGRTLIQRIYDDHFLGFEEVEEMQNTLAAVDLPSPDREEAAKRMVLQKQNAREWRDVINTYFHRLSGVDDQKNRTIYD